MSAKPSSSNPFRTKEISTSSLPVPASPSLSIPITASAAAAAASSSSTSESTYIAHRDLQTGPPVSAPTSILDGVAGPKKAIKKVRVQSPPPSSPSLRDSASSIGNDAFPTTQKFPATILRDGVDPFDSISPDTSDDESDTGLSKAPANPFQKTLETIEHPERGPVAPVSSVANAGRASLDVEAFKRLLMTGSSGLGASTPSPAPTTHRTLGDGSNSTDAPAILRQSVFEAIQEAHPESPRTSHETSDPDEYRQGLISDSRSLVSGRKKPDPPSSRHGKLIKVELRDGLPENTLNMAFSPTSAVHSDAMNNSLGSKPSQSDLNKPLPLAPRRASHDSDGESIFDREAAGKLPEPPSPLPPIKRKVPPAPPISRRHSQRISDSKLARSNSARTSHKVEEDKVEEEEKETIVPSESYRPRSDNAKAPPPPPSRRPATVRNSSHHSPLSSPSTVSLPAPPPPRGLLKQSSGRPASVISLDMSTNSKRVSPAAPPPPPRSRHGHGSMDAQSPREFRKQSYEQMRQSVENTPHSSEVSFLPQIKGAEGQPAGHDILADLSALQREIDALRVQSDKENIT